MTDNQFAGPTTSIVGRPATFADIALVLPDVRPLVRQECLAAGGDLEEALTKAIEGDKFAELLSLPTGEPLALWGLNEVPPHDGIVHFWLTTTIAAESHADSLFADLRERVARASRHFPCICGAVHEDNGLHLRLLKELGARFVARPAGQEGSLRQFIITTLPLPADALLAAEAA